MKFFTFIFFLVLGTLIRAAPGQEQGPVLPDPSVQGDFQILYNGQAKPDGFKARECVPYLKNRNPAIYSYSTDLMPCYFAKDAQCKEINASEPFTMMNRKRPIRPYASLAPAFICYQYQ